MKINPSYINDIKTSHLDRQQQHKKTTQEASNTVNLSTDTPSVVVNLSSNQTMSMPALYQKDGLLVKKNNASKTSRYPEAQQAILNNLESNKNRQPDAQKHIHTQGTLPHHGIYDQSIAAKKDLSLMHDAAMAWKAGQGNQWLSYAKKYLMSWVNTYHPSYNPIDETNFDDMIATYSTIKSHLSSNDQEKAKKFFSQWAWGYIHSAEHAQKHDPINGISNWQSHRIKLATLLSASLNDDKLLKRSEDLFKKQVSKNIHADGQTYDFGQRDAIHYVVYDLQPLVQAALAARKKDNDWFNWTAKTGASLSKAIDWLTPYASGEKPHEEFVHSKEKFDAVRHDANVPGFSGLFKPKDAGKLYWLLTQFNTSFEPIAQKMQANPPAYIAFKH